MGSEKQSERRPDQLLHHSRPLLMHQALDPTDSLPAEADQPDLRSDLSQLRFSQSESQNQPFHQDCPSSQFSQLPRLRDLPESKCSQRSHSQLYLFKAKQQLPDSPQLADLPSTLLAPPRLNSSQLLLPPLQPLLLQQLLPPLKLSTSLMMAVSHHQLQPSQVLMERSTTIITITMMKREPLLLITQANLLLQNFYCNSNSQQAVKTFSLIIVAFLAHFIIKFLSLQK